ncbi:hypothetical protein CVT24_001224 [Panaeolus cyanescens]|uniref:Uncharacterized protein n=1 Tax=Panaeolus cyanescens TaxID=181874 RepID=A0A409YG00_9AGAR|nr:hypothetical protein CVT24_001224 [Panaeolus cyanescens]
MVFTNDQHTDPCILQQAVNCGFWETLQDIWEEFITSFETKPTVDFVSQDFMRFKQGIESLHHGYEMVFESGILPILRDDLAARTHALLKAACFNMPLIVHLTNITAQFLQMLTEEQYETLGRLPAVPDEPEFNLCAAAISRSRFTRAHGPFARPSSVGSSSSRSNSSKPHSPPISIDDD